MVTADFVLCRIISACWRARRKSEVDASDIQVGEFLRDFFALTHALIVERNVEPCTQPFVLAVTI